MSCFYYLSKDEQNCSNCKYCDSDICNKCFNSDFWELSFSSERDLKDNFGYNLTIVIEA